MKSTMVRIGKLIIAMAIAALALYGLLVLVACIPRTAVQKQSEESADYFCSHKLFTKTMRDLDLSIQDNYADCILFNLAYSMDSKHPFTSVIESPFRDYSDREVNDAYHELVHDADKSTNAEYSRYWHGSLVFVKPLLCLGSITLVRIILGSLVCVLAVVNVLWLIREKHLDIAIIYMVSLVAVQFFMIFLSIEYWSVFFIMQAGILAVLAIVKKQEGKGLEQSCEVLFLWIGMVTAFMDFLTTETLTYSIPMLILLMLLSKVDRLPKGQKLLWFLLRTGLCWVVGYAFMFLLKWGLAAMLSDNATTGDTLQAVAYRFTGAVSSDNTEDGEALGIVSRLELLILRNVGCLVFMNDKMTAGTIVVIIIGLLFTGFLVWYYFRSKKYSRYELGAYTILAMLPFVRFLVLSNHAYIHYFFTYRALMVTIGCILWVIYDGGLRNCRERNKITHKK